MSCTNIYTYKLKLYFDLLEYSLRMFSLYTDMHIVVDGVIFCFTVCLT